MKNKKPFAEVKYLLAQLHPFTNTVFATDDITGLHFYAYKRDVIGRQIFKTGGYDKEFTQWLIERFRGKEGNFIDVGANLGYFACMLGTLADQKGKVLAIEPEPENLKLLKKNLQENGLHNVVIAPVAVGEEEGEATLNVYKGSNRGRHTLTPIKTHASIVVPIRKVDDLVATHFPEDVRIDFMKIDVEGYESYVIKGAASTLKRTDALLIEYAPYLLREAGKEGFSFVHNLFSQFRIAHEIGPDGFRQITMDECLARKDAFNVIFER